MLYFGKHKLMAIKLACYWAILFVLPLTNANTTVVCDDTYSNTQGLQCFPCSPGYTKKDDCRTNQTLAQCTQCNEGTYQPHCISANETGECRNCTSCAVYIQNCTIYHDAVCGWSNNVKEGTSEGNGFLVLMLPLIWLFAVLVFGCAFVFCQYRYRQHGKQVSNNKWNNVVDREMHTGDYNSSDRSKGEYMCTITTKNELAGSLENRWSTLKKTEISTKNINSSVGKVPTTECLFGENDKKKAPRGSTTNIVDVHGDADSQDRSTTGSLENIGSSLENIESSLKNIDSTVGKVPTIGCLFGENDKKKDSRGSTPNIVDVHVNGSSQDRSQPDESKVNKIEDVPKEGKDGKLMAIISPIQGPGVNSKSNIYGGLQLTRERLQFNGDSKNTPTENTENTNNKVTTKTGTPLSIAENQNIDVKELAKYGENENTNKKGPTNNWTPSSHAENQTVHLREPAESEAKECLKKYEAIVHKINRQTEILTCAGDETRNEVKDLEDYVEIDWIKVFKELVPNLPADDTWKFFAMELLHFCQQKCGKPQDIDNKIKEIDNITNRKSKGVFLAYLEVLNTWKNIMAKDADFDQIKQALQTFDNNIIMEEFEKIKRDPLSRKHCMTKNDTTVVNWKPTELMTQPSKMVTCALYESTLESSNAYIGESHSQQQYLQVSSAGAGTSPLAIEQCLPGPSRHADSTRTYNSLYSNQTRHRSRKEIKNRLHWKKSKLERKSKAGRQLRKLKRENINLIKKMLAYEEIPLVRQEYDKILKHTIDVISKHTNVHTEIMSALTFESFCEMSQNQNHERYVLYSGRPKLMLDKKQFQCLKFYVKKARRRVIKALNEVNEHADSTYLFITYDGKSLPNDFQRRKPTLKTLHASTSSSDTSITDESDIMSQSDSQISDDEFESDYVQNLETSLSTTQRAICFGERTFNSRMATESESIVNGISTSIPQSGLMPQNILEAPETLRIIEEEDDTPVDIEDSLKGLCDSTDSKIKRMDVPENSNELIEQKMDVAGTYASVQNERVGTTSADKQVDDLIDKIEKELEDSQYV